MMNSLKRFGVQPSNAGVRAGLVLAIGAAALGGCATPSAIRDGTSTAVVSRPDLPAPDPRDLGGGLQSAYYVGPQDKLDIVVYQLPELTRIVTVEPTGAINLPFVGQVQAGGKTTLEIRDEIYRKLRGDVLQNPDVTVALSEGVSQRITVEGAVGQPGQYSVAGSTTLLRSIAFARGTSNIANEKVVAIFRTINGQRMAAVFNLDMIRQGLMEDPVVYGNDLVVVERSRGKVLLRDVIGTVPLLGVFRTATAF